jgi:hypothetical protein
MPLAGYDETLARFRLQKLKSGVDLQVTKGGDIAVTRDGDLQMGNTQVNALFRLVERWRRSESMINDLFGPMLLTAQQLEELLQSRAQNDGPSLHIDAKAYHEVTDSILKFQSVSSVLAGAIFVVSNNLLQRFKLDLNSSDEQLKRAGIRIKNHAVGEIFSSAAANFRHHDEWACSKTPTKVQRASMEVLCSYSIALRRPLRAFLRSAQTYAEIS